MIRPLLLFPLVLALLPLWSQPNASDAPFRQLRSDYTATYADLEVPGLQLSYQAYLDGLPPLALLEQQLVFFGDMEARLHAIDPGRLSDSLQLDYFLLAYDVHLQRERLALEIPWVRRADTATDAGIYHQKDGRNWYRYLLHRWTGTYLTPEALFAEGELEVGRVSQAINRIREGFEMDSSAFYAHLREDRFFAQNVDTLAARFRAKQATVHGRLESTFPPLPAPPASIAQGRDRALAQTPGFYRPDQQTFYFNFFDQPYKWRELDWLFIHEATPGHHYQVQYANALPLGDFRRLFSHPGYMEGWAAYVEYLGEEVGLYASPYDWLGKWEWDLVRSVRVPLDIGINYYGWTNEEAIEYWRRFVPGQDEIASREIERMRRWPAQVLTYKVGGQLLLERWLAAQRQADFDPVRFHQGILDTGPVPCEWYRIDGLSARDRDATLLIRRNIAQFSRDLVAQDFEAVVASYTADGKLFPNSGDILQGEPAIRDYWTPPADREASLVYHRVLPQEIIVEGGMAYDWGYYEGRTLLPDGSESSWKGKYVIVWKEVAPRSWKIYLDSWSRI